VLDSDLKIYTSVVSYYMLESMKSKPLKSEVTSLFIAENHALSEYIMN
jgi:hypothetical protein